MIKAILLATVVPFMAQHRNIVPSNEVTTNFYGSVTGVVTRTYIAEHGGGGLEPKDVGLISTNVVTNVVTKSYVESLGISGGGGSDTNAVNDLIRSYDATNLTERIAYRTTTNDVNAIIASSNLCTVAAAQDMTNAVLEYADDAFLKTSSGGYGSVNWIGEALYVGAPSGFIVSHINTLAGMWADYHAGDENLPQYLASTSVTNGGAKAYADATKESKIIAGTNVIASVVRPYTNYEYIVRRGTEYSKHYSPIELPYRPQSEYPSYRDDSCLIRDGYFVGGGGPFSALWWIGHDYGGAEGTVENEESPNLKISTFDKTFISVDQKITHHENVFFSNEVSQVVYSLPKLLSGRTYDFANGSNFTLRVYTALTNVIQTLGGNVRNPPTFN